MGWIQAGLCPEQCDAAALHLLAEEGDCLTALVTTRHLVTRAWRQSPNLTARMTHGLIFGGTAIKGVRSTTSTSPYVTSCARVLPFRQ